MEPVTHQQKNEAIAGFPFEGILVSENPYGSGHINDTFLLVFDLGDDEEVKVILQRMNREIRRRTRVVGTFPDGKSALMLVCARLRYVSGKEWGSKRYLCMKYLYETADGVT